MSQDASWSHAARALRSRNYRLFFTGQSISLIGTWMTRLATSWLVYRLTSSALLLGIVGFAGQIPAFFLAPLAGVWIDRWDRHRVLVVTQILAMLQSLALAALALTGNINIGWVLVLTLVQGLINAFDMPARQSFVVDMLEDRADLSNAIALNSSMVNGGRLVGPAIAGAVVALVGEGWCFLIDGVSYIAVIWSLLAMRSLPIVPVKIHKRLTQELVEGWRYVSRTPSLRAILLLLAFISVVAAPYTVLIPMVAGTLLGGGPNTLGFLMAASGVGALTSAISLALRRSVIGLGRMVGIASAALGTGLVVLGISRNLVLSSVMMLATGFGLMQQIAGSNTILQTLAEDDKRGRVMSFYTFALLGCTPIGSLLGGIIAQRIGTAETLMGSGVLCTLGALWFWMHVPHINAAIEAVSQHRGMLPVGALPVGARQHTPGI
jgi:MFS family permease